MSDRFKFRVWDKINEIWVKNFSIDEQGCVEGFYNPPQAMNRRLVLMQCTGLKDKNGKLIYEGDVVTYDWLTPIGKVWRTDGKHIVEWHDGFTVIGNIAGYDIKHGKKRNVQVIGNIYENPELLKECENE